MRRLLAACVAELLDLYLELLLFAALEVIILVLAVDAAHRDDDPVSHGI
jgi:hypothetical protein